MAAAAAAIFAAVVGECGVHGKDEDALLLSKQANSRALIEESD